MVGSIRTLNSERWLSMRYNPPPNWPEPPEGWAPPPGWSPDPSWPPPPTGWRLWVEEDAPGAHGTKAALSRLERTGDDVEYFGDDRAWSEDSGRSPAVDQLDTSATASPPRPTELAPEDLSVHHLGHHASIRWDEQKYVIGTVVAVAAGFDGDQRDNRRSRNASLLSARPGGRRPCQTPSARVDLSSCWEWAHATRCCRTARFSRIVKDVVGPRSSGDRARLS